MGILRVYLALCVVADHAGTVFPWQMHNGSQAVQIFYIISGFYMAMVLSDHRYAKPRDFYLSRFLRIFPPYWIALLATLVTSVAGGLFFNRWLLLRAYVSHPFGNNGTAGVLLAGLSNVTLVGQDWIMFLQNDPGQSLRFTANFWNNAHPLWHYLVIPQCWSIGVELTFYAFAPYLNRARSLWLAGIALGAFAARLLAYRYLGLAHDPWSYRFFPFEISLFLFGMLGYRLYVRTKPHHPSPRWRSISLPSYVIGAAALLLVCYLHLRVVACLAHFMQPELALLATYPFSILAMPVLFFAFGSQKLDRVIGELSYPIYLIHYIVIIVVITVLGYSGVNIQTGISSALVSILLSILFYRGFIARLDRKRHSLTIKRSELRNTADGV